MELLSKDNRLRCSLSQMHWEGKYGCQLSRLIQRLMPFRVLPLKVSVFVVTRVACVGKNVNTW